MCLLLSSALVVHAGPGFAIYGSYPVKVKTSIRRLILVQIRWRSALMRSFLLIRLRVVLNGYIVQFRGLLLRE